ncbi:septation protein IspZ [Providencia huashanensis]|uniref:septation protein IspZ n=1 Tax=Providencia huashanensis TaxID=3037798 RepID=UPI00389A8835
MPFGYFIYMNDNLIFLKRSISYIVFGAVLLLPLSNGNGILYLLNGKNLSLRDVVWIRYRKIMGLLYIMFGVIIYIVHLYLSIDIWVYLSVYGSIFVMWFLPAIVAMFCIFHDSGSEAQSYENVR